MLSLEDSNDMFIAFRFIRFTPMLVQYMPPCTLRLEFVLNHGENLRDSHLVSFCYGNVSGSCPRFEFLSGMLSISTENAFNHLWTKNIFILIHLCSNNILLLYLSCIEFHCKLFNIVFLSLCSWCPQMALMVLTVVLYAQTHRLSCRPLWRGQEALETPDRLPSSQ